MSAGWRNGRESVYVFVLGAVVEKRVGPQGDVMSG